MNGYKYIWIDVNEKALTSRIIEQSHRNSVFGKNGDEFRASNGMVLRSMARPVKGESAIWMRGDDTSRDNDLLNFFSKKELYGFIEAVSEYNSFFSLPNDKNFSKELDKILDI
jgi:hypothetical protein